MSYRLRRLGAPALAAAALAALAVPSPALSATVLDTCDTPVGSSLVVNRVVEAGCVRIAVTPATATAPASMRLFNAPETMPGWVYTVAKNGPSSVVVKFANAATGGKRELSVKFGTTVIK